MAGSVELRNSLTAQLGVELGSTVTFDYPTIPALARYIVSQLPMAEQQAQDEPDPSATSTPAGPAIAAEDLRYAALQHYLWSRIFRGRRACNYALQTCSSSSAAGCFVYSAFGLDDGFSDACLQVKRTTYLCCAC